MPFVDLDSARLYYEVHGRGPALVFAHGLGGNHLSWWQQVPVFRDRYTCVTFAHRGFWPSECADATPDPRRFADDLAGLIGHLGFADVRLVAQSMGGWTCLEYALRQPERVRALALADTTGTLTHPEVSRLIRSTAPQAAALAQRGVHPAAGARMAEEQPTLHALYRQIDALATGIDKDALRAALGSMQTTAPEAVAALRPSLLCIAGEEDVVIPADAVAVLASLVPGARMERVARAGHSVYFERAAEFNRLVGEFLAGVDS